MKKYTDEQIAKALEAAKATLAIEGLKMEERHKELAKSRLEGKITHEEFIQQAKEMSKG